jgi:hypothetical protein
MDDSEHRVSVIEPVGQAVDRAKRILFEPFDIGKWFAIGFCAWLAFLSEGGGGGGFRHSGNRSNYAESFSNAREALLSDVMFSACIGSAIIIAVLAIWLIVLWLSSRGRFMFLNCVARDSSEIKAPWSRFRGLANNYFLFRLAAGVIIFLFSVPLAAAIGWCGWIISKGGTYVNAFIIMALVAAAFSLAGVWILFLVVMKFTREFVVPIMYVHGLSCVDGWRRLWSIASLNKGKFLLYLLFRIAIAMAVTSIIILAVFMTCCCAACFLAIPYIGTVLMLPILVFVRAYSLYYLRQYGSDFDVFAQVTVE